MTFSRSKSGSALTRAPRQAWVLEPRMMFDAAAVATAAEVAAHVAPTDTAPGLDATPVKATIAITDTSDSFEPIDLFSDVKVSADKNGQDLKDLVITVNRTGANQALIIDGKSIALAAGNGATRDQDGFSYKVTVEGETTKITVNIDSFAENTADAAALIDGIAYKPLDKTVAGGEVVVTLKSLSDAGDKAQDIANLDIHATVTIDSQINVPPVISGEALKEAELLNTGVLADSTEVTYSGDGKYVYAAGADNSISVFAVDGSGHLTLKQSRSDIDGLGKVSQMVVSADGKSLYSISGTDSIVHLNLNADGTLGESHIIPSGNGKATGGLAISADGKQVYIGTFDNGLVVFTRDSDSGALAYSHKFDGRSPKMVVTGDYVYAIDENEGFASPPKITVYQRSESENGRLKQVDDLEIKNVSTDLATTIDGRYLYVGDAKGITTYHLDNKLTKTNTITGISVSSLSFDAANHRLYVADADGVVHLYSVTDKGDLIAQGTLATSTNGQDIVVSNDGRSVLISGNGLNRFSAIQTLLRGETIMPASGLTLSDADFDRLSDNVGNYGNGTLLIERSGGASANDIFGFNNSNGLSFEQGEIHKNGKAIATFAQRSGTLTITFLDGTSRDDANAILRQVTYSNSNENSDANGSIVTLELRANDGKADSQIVNLDILLTVNSAPQLTTTPVTSATYDTTGAHVPLFRDTAISTGEAGQSIIQLTLNLSGLSNVSQEFIVIDGTRIDLSQSSEGEIGNNTYSYVRNGDNATLAIDSSKGLNIANAQTLVNSIAYVNDNAKAPRDVRMITLASIRDSGGTTGDGKDTADLAITATITLAINNAPTWELALHNPEHPLYYADGTLTGYDEFVTDIVLSSDGKTLVISGSTENNNSGTSYLRIYSRNAATGELTLVQTFTQGESDDPTTEAIEANGLNAISSMVFHGNNLYVAGNTGDEAVYSLVRFSYDAQTGKYTYGGIVATQGEGGVTGLGAPITKMAISADGKSLYTVNGGNFFGDSTDNAELAQFAIDPQSGALTHLATYQGGSRDRGMNSPGGIAISPDGTSVYVSNQRNSMLTIFSRDTQSGKLTYRAVVNTETIAADPNSAKQPDDDRYLLQLQDVVISPDSKYVYTGSYDQGTVSVFSRNAADGKLTYAGTLSLYEHLNELNIRDMVMAEDGSALYVGFSLGGVAILSRDSATGALTFVGRHDIDNALTHHLAVSPDGLNIYGGRSQFNSGVAILSAQPNTSYSTVRPSLPFAEGVHFSDVDFDAQNNYQGIELTLRRSDAPSADDRFSFKEGSGLRLEGKQVMRGDTALAEFVSIDGTLTIRFIANVDKATANQLLQQVTYRNGAAEQPAQVDLTLTVSDGSKSSETTLALLRAPLSPSPTLTAEGQQTSVIVGTGEQPGAVDLFKNVAVQLDDHDEPLANLVIIVNRSSTDQALVIDGHDVVLQSGSGKTSTNGYQYVVDVADGVTRIHIDIASSTDGATPDAVATLIDGLAYKVLADTAATGTVTVNLASLSDKSDQIEPNISASVTLRDQEQLPTLSADVGSIEYSGFSFELADESSRYAGIKSIAIEGDKVYALSSTSEFKELPSGKWEDVETTRLFVFERNNDGKLVLRDTLVADEANGLKGAITLGLSRDGQMLHAMTEGGVALFSRDTVSGSLTALGALSDNSLGTIRDAQTHDNHLYISTGESIKVYQRNGDTWAELSSQSPSDESMQFSSLQVSPDGKYLFAGRMGGNALVSVFSIGDGGALNWIADAKGLTSAEFYNAASVTMSPDGKSLYIAETIIPETDGSDQNGGEQQGTSRLNVFSVAAEGKLTARNVVELDSSIETIAISPDSSMVAILRGQQFSKVLALYGRSATGSLIHLTSVEGFGDDPYANGTADAPGYVPVKSAHTIAFGSKGEQLYLSLTLNWADQDYNNLNYDGLAVLDLKPVRVTFTERGAPVALLPGGTLDAPQRDAGNSYQGASLSVERSGGAQEGDALTFIDGDGLTLKDDGKIWKGETAVAEMANSDGKLSVTFLVGASHADAQQVLRQLAYSSSSADPTRAGATAVFKLVFNDGDGNNAILDATVNLVGLNDAAVVQTTPQTPTFTVGGAPVTLFKDTKIDTIEAGQKVSRLEITINGVAVGDAIGVDGGKIVLDQSVFDKGGIDWKVQVGDSGIEYRVSIKDGKAVITLFPVRDGSGTAALVDSLTYSYVGSENSGTRTIGLELVEDVDLQHPDPKNDRTVVDGQANVTLFDQPMLSPKLGAEPGSLEYGGFSFELKDGASQYPGIKSIAIEGDKIYALSSTSKFQELPSGGWGDVETTRLFVFDRNSDGKLVLRDTLLADEANGLKGAITIGLSRDGQMLHAMTEGGVALFSRDTVSGSLTALGTLSDSSLGTIRDVQNHDNRLYISTGESIKVYQRNNDAWTQLSDHPSTDGSMQFSSLQVSPDGKYLFAGRMGGNALVSVFGIGDGGALNWIADAKGASAAEFYDAATVTISPDGKSLYVIETLAAESGNQGGGEPQGRARLHVLSVAEDGKPTAVQVIELASTLKTIALSPDSSQVAILLEETISKTIELYSRTPDGKLLLVTSASALGGDPNSKGTEEGPAYVALRNARTLAFSADGKQLYVPMDINWQGPEDNQYRNGDGILAVDLKPFVGTFIERGKPVAIIPAGILSAPQLDAKNGGTGDYNGASITVERDGGASVGDTFAFIDNDALKLDAENNTILLDGVAIATFTLADGKLTVTFTTTVTQATAQSVLRHIAYANNSNDPTRNGARASFNLVLNDGSRHSSAFVINVDLQGINDPPVIESTPLTPTFAAEGERVKLFENTHIDTIEAGQNIWQVIVTLDAVNRGDVLGVGGGKISLDGNSGRTGTGLQYQIIKDVEGGKTTVILYVTAMPVDAVEKLIDGLTYGNNREASGQRTITLSVRENAGDSKNNLSEESIMSSVALTAAAEPNTAPEIKNGTTQVDYVERATPVVLLPNIDVSDAQMDKFNAGKGNYDGARLTITLGQGKSDSDVLGFKTENGLELKDGVLLKGGKAIGSVSIADGVMTIRFSDDAGEIPTTEDVQNTLRQITYANTSHVPTESVAMSITLADQRGLTSTALEQSIVIKAVNDAPLLEVDPVLTLGDLEHVHDIADISGLGTPKTSVASTDGSRIYIADEQGNIALFNREADNGELHYVSTFPTESDGNGIKQMVLSADGKSLYALREDGNAILWFNTDADGAITYQATLVSDFNVDEGVISGIGGMTLSADGKNLYFINSYQSGIAYFSRDTETGALTYAESIEGDMWNEPYLWQPTDIVSQGNLVYVVTNASNGSTLIVYQRDESGELDLLGYTRTGKEDLANLQHVAVSADGNTILVSSGADNSEFISVFSLNPTTKELTHQWTLSGEQTVKDIALSADGQMLFITLSDGTLNYYAAATGEQKGTLSGITGAGQITLTPGGSVIVAGDTVNVSRTLSASSPQISNDGKMVAAIPALRVSDIELDAAANGNGNYGGASLRIAGDVDSRFGFIDANGYTFANREITFNGHAVAQWVTNSDGVLTVTFADGVTTKQANDIVRQIAYGWVGTTMPETKTVALNVTFNDGDLDSAAQNVVVAINGAPIAGSEAFTFPPLMMGISPDTRALQLPENLFTDPDGDTLLWHVDGLPKGMTFDAQTRQISGTPSEAGTFTIDVTVSDGKAEASRALTLTVEANTPPVLNDIAAETVQQALGQTLRAGERYMYALPQDLFTDSDVVKGDVLRWSAEGLPAGLYFDPATLTISGTPTVEGTFTLTLRAQDSAQGSATLTVALTVEREMTFIPIQRTEMHQEWDEVEEIELRASEYAGSSAATERGDRSSTQAVLDSLNNIERPQSRSWGMEPIMPSLMPELDPVNFSSRDRVTPATDAASPLFQTVRGQATSIESSLSSLQGALLPDGTGALTFTLPHHLFTTRDGHVALTLQLANGNPLPSWIHFDSRHGVVRIVDAGALQVNQIQLSLKAQAADGSSRILPITLRVAPAVESAAPSVPLTQWREPAAADLPASDRQDAMTELAHRDGKPAFSEQLDTRHKHDELLNALAQLTGTASS
ncbi:beta-propeller fold lactonase family protein [Pectobacterium cacticida]|uniref:beta-propeller fold lactonase family protein n=1 Tax=Pectobacterium cacticida TaxID=69221 RepID=UPI0039878C7E